MKMQSMSHRARQTGLGGLGWKQQHRTRESVLSNKLQKLLLVVIPI